MTSRNHLIEVSRIRELLHYEQESGEFTWLERIIDNPKAAWWNKRWAGQKAGHTGKNGRVQIQIDNHNLMAGRVAWAYVTGNWPEEEISPRDGDHKNLRFINLTLKSREEISLTRGPNKTRGAAEKGVYWVEKFKRWRAYFETAGKQRLLGSFKTKEEALSAYEAANEAALTKATAKKKARKS